MQEEIEQKIREVAHYQARLFHEIPKIETFVREIVKCYRHNKKILVCGDEYPSPAVQDMVYSFINMSKEKRNPLEIMAINTNAPPLRLFQRQIKTYEEEGDILFGLSTTGTPRELIRTFKKGKEIGTINLSLTGNNGGKLKEISDYNINVDAKEDSRIKETHMVLYDIIYELVGKKLFHEL